MANLSWSNIQEARNYLLKQCDWTQLVDVPLSDEDKEKFFFIFNRYFSKKYTKKSQLLNNKNVDKSISLDLWYYFMLDKPYPNWFWSKSPKFEKTDIPDSDFKLLFLKLGLNKEQDLIITTPDSIFQNKIKSGVLNLLDKIGSAFSYKKQHIR
jgi:hypothetical protein